MAAAECPGVVTVAGVGEHKKVASTRAAILKSRSIDRVLAADVPGPPDQLGPPSIFLSPLAQRALLPGIKTTGLDAQADTLTEP